MLESTDRPNEESASSLRQLAQHLIGGVNDRLLDRRLSKFFASKPLSLLSVDAVTLSTPAPTAETIYTKNFVPLVSSPRQNLHISSTARPSKHILFGSYRLVELLPLEFNSHPGANKTFGQLRVSDPETGKYGVPRLTLIRFLVVYAAVAKCPLVKAAEFDKHGFANNRVDTPRQTRRLRASVRQTLGHAFTPRKWVFLPTPTFSRPKHTPPVLDHQWIYELLKREFPR